MATQIQDFRSQLKLGNELAAHVNTGRDAKHIRRGRARRREEHQQQGCSEEGRGMGEGTTKDGDPKTKVVGNFTYH